MSVVWISPTESLNVVLQLPSWKDFLASSWGLTRQELTDLQQRVDVARSEVVKQNRALTLRSVWRAGGPRKWLWKTHDLMGMDGYGFSWIIYLSILVYGYHWVSIKTGRFLHRNAGFFQDFSRLRPCFQVFAPAWTIDYTPCRSLKRHSWSPWNATFLGLKSQLCVGQIFILAGGSNSIDHWYIIGKGEIHMVAGEINPHPYWSYC